LDFLRHPWPWFVAGPLIGLFVPALLLLGNRVFGFSSNLRHLCAAAFPGKVEFFRYDWKAEGGWNLVFLAGTVAGGFVAVHFQGTPDIALSEAARRSLSELGLHDLSGLAPREVFGWAGLLTLRGLVLIVVGGFLVGFGTAYAGGCTSGHAISGLADLQLPSLVAVLGFFAGGLLATHLLIPLLF
jgi:uncharacterized membrane protein YedE/YeeE